MATILVVDDHTAGRQFLVTLLGYTAHRVFEAENGVQALEIAHAEHPDLIITDMLMPVMGGYELARQLREQRDFDSIAVIFYTATFRESEANSLAKAAGVQYVLPKPAEPQAILDMVNTALGQTSASGSPSRHITMQLPDPLQVVSEKLTAKSGELEGANLRLSELIALGMEIGAEHDPERLLEKFCESARKILNAEYAAVRILGKDGESTRYFITSGMDPETVARLGPPPTGEGVPSALLNEHQAIRLRDLTADPRSVGFPPGHPIMRSFLGVPIATSVQKYGNFYLTEKIGEQEFSEEDERLAVTLASQLAVAYENARLYDDIQRHAATLQIEISRREQAEDSLRNSEELFRTSFQYSAVGMCITALDGRLQTVNRALEDLLGFTKSELEGRYFNDITHPEDLEIGREADVRLMSGGAPSVSFEKRYLHKTGGVVWTHVSSTLLRDSSGTPLHFITQILDITERKRAQDKSERQTQRLKILREIDLAILAANSVENIVGAALDHMRELIECRRVSMVLIDWGTNEVVVFEVRAVIETTLQKGTRLPLALFQNMVQTLSTNQPLLINDLNALADPPQFQSLIREGLRSLCLLPLFSQGNLIGSISLSSEISGFFDEEKIALGREVANQVAIAIIQTRLAQGLRESEEKYHAFFQNSLDAILLTMPDGSIQAANPAACEMFGRTEAEICALGRSGLVDSHDLRLAALLEERARTGKAFGELTMLRHDGTPFPVELSSALFQDRQGNPRASMIIREITERKQLENDLRESEQKFSVLFKRAPFAAQLATFPAGEIVEANEEFEKLVGYSREELIGKTSLELNMYPDPEIRARMVAEFQARGFVRNAELAFRTRSGDLRHLLTSSDLIDIGQKKHVLTTAQDITELKQAEERLKESEEKFSKSFHSSPVAINITRAADSVLMDANESFLKLFGYEQTELLGHTPFELNIFPDMAVLSEVREQLRQQGSVHNLEMDVKTRLGEVREVFFSVEPILIRNELHDLTTMVDITERKRAEIKLAGYAGDLKRSNAELEQFAYVSSHDLQEPLRMVSSYVQLLAKRYQGQLDADADVFIGFAVEGAARMQQLINDLLMYSRVGTQGKPFAPTNFEQALENSLANLQIVVEENGAAITHDPLPTLMADPVQITQLFQNLVGNAIKFHSEAPPRVHIHAERQDQHWLFSITDNGIGVDPQFSERIFVIFQRLHMRTEYQGNGVGLAICKKIVERHGGRIWVEPASGQGSSFYFTIGDSGGKYDREK